MVNWDNICLVLARTRLVDVLSKSALHLYTHVELGVTGGFVEVALDHIFSRSRHVLSGNQVFALRYADRSNSIVASLSMVGVNGIIALGTYRLLVGILVLSDLVRVLMDDEAGDLVNWVNGVSIGSGGIVLILRGVRLSLLLDGLKRSSKDGLGLVIQIFHFFHVVVSSGAREHSLLINVGLLEVHLWRSGDAKSVRGFGKVHRTVLVGSRRVLYEVELPATGAEGAIRPIPPIDFYRARKFVGSGAGPVGLSGVEMVLASDAGVESGSE